jgi:PhnB protein
MPDGRIGHAEVELDGQTLMLASVYPEIGLATPMKLDGVHCQVYCYVDEVDEHFSRARAAGAIIVNEPENQDHGARSYRAMDPEGHRWIFANVDSAS